MTTGKLFNDSIDEWRVHHGKQSPRFLFTRPFVIALRNNGCCQVLLMSPDPSRNSIENSLFTVQKEGFQVKYDAKLFVDQKRASVHPSEKKRLNDTSD